ncbi:MAG TPA: inorganic phosphate transporter [Phycisphaerae bacterium]|nr:inorganic phosphate transporter [Phycisphaerae bacterium]
MQHRCGKDRGVDAINNTPPKGFLARAKDAVPSWWYGAVLFAALTYLFGKGFTLAGIFVFSVCMLIWDTIEVGRNDAANLINAVYGARLMTRKRAVILAGIAVIIGASLSGGVIETARKGIFDPTKISLEQAAAIYISVYLVDTVLLYGYSAFGMPVSTTACLVFELIGAAVAMSFIANTDNLVNWSKASSVVLAIIVSIFLSGFSSFLVQRVVRGVIGQKTEDLRTMKIHGAWIGGGIASGMVFFMIIKGMKKVPGIDTLNALIHKTPMGPTFCVFGLWFFFAGVISVFLMRYGKRAAVKVFPVLAVCGMLSMAFAFGQNDLANCASPGLATISIIQNWDAGIKVASESRIDQWQLFVCGILLFMGMRTKNATRVTKAAVNMGSHADRVRLYAPGWCLTIGEWLARRSNREESLVSTYAPTRQASRQHYDALRATVIMGVSASVIAIASSFKMPVSTTYVTFAALVGTGMGDRIFQKGDAGLKIARSIWVVFSWFFAAFIAAAFTALVCGIVYQFGMIGLVVVLGINLALRQEFKRRGDEQSRRTREEMLERAYPERYATEEDY